MPRRELCEPAQIISWLEDWGAQLCENSTMILIGSGGLLWHVHQAGLATPLPENSMDVDPITDSESVAELAYEAMIGSEFELKHGWHVNLMPQSVLREMPAGWEARASRKAYGRLQVIVPCVSDLLAPKLKRGEPRDLAHANFMASLGLYQPKS